MITLHYLTLLRYPSRYVNRLQVIKMSEAFSRFSKFTLFVEIIPRNRHTVYKEYSVRSKINIKEVGEQSTLWPKSFFAALHYKKIIQDDAEDVVYYIRDVLLAFFLTFLSKKFRTNYFFEIHALEKFSNVIYKRVFVCARGIISTNKEKKSEITRKWNVSKQNIFTARNAVDIKRFQSVGMQTKDALRDKFYFPKDRRIVMYVGSAQRWKGVDIVRQCAQTLSDYTFIVIGAGWDKREDNLIEISHISSDLVPKYLACADLLIAPYPSQYTISSKWTSPIKIVEYMASGIPIITSDLPAIREFLTSSLGLLVTPSKEGFNNGIIWAFDQYKEMEKRADNAKKYVLECLTWEKRAEHIIHFINQKVSRP